MEGGLIPQILELNVKLQLPTYSSNGPPASTFNGIASTVSTKCCEFRTQAMIKVPTLPTLRSSDNPMPESVCNSLI